MKSAYELAMERLGKSQGDVKPLTEAQKAAIAEVDNLYQSKIAEKEVFLGGLIAKARAMGSIHEMAELEEQRSRELRRLRDKAELEKEKVRNQS